MLTTCLSDSDPALASDSESDDALTSEVARIIDCSAATVRAYERRGWLHARRTRGGVRIFSRFECERFRAARDRKQGTSDAA